MNNMRKEAEAAWSEASPSAYELGDKAYTYLKEVVDEVRACGKYVFYGNENRLVGYSSA